MKIPQLLVQYLYKYRRMPLPGIGIFTLDKSVVLPDADDRALHSMPNAVQFQNANIAAADKELISFICEHTGKIKPLAISDLESYLNLGTEMLNIGKPFYLEGIGTITKNKAGKFDFMPGEYSLIRENTGTQETVKKKTYTPDIKSLHVPKSLQNRNLLRLVVAIAALAIVGAGGWLMYKKNGTATTETSSNVPVSTEPVPVQKDSLDQAKAAQDSSKNAKPDSVNPSDLNKPGVNFKFIILTTYNKEHALRRFNQLNSYDLKIHLYQKDSAFFKVYFQFPALVKDTTHIKDSLRREYAHEITIEQ